jgi:hypothetical protein
MIHEQIVSPSTIYLPLFFCFLNKTNNENEEYINQPLKNKNKLIFSLPADWLRRIQWSGSIQELFPWLGWSL